MSDFKRVEFNDGIVLRGDLFQATGAKRGIVVMAQGLTLPEGTLHRGHGSSFPMRRYLGSCV